jgi:hypothetical protein
MQTGCILAVSGSSGPSRSIYMNPTLPAFPMHFPLKLQLSFAFFYEQQKWMTGLGQ